jgi:hypothetical protein
MNLKSTVFRTVTPYRPVEVRPVFSDIMSWNEIGVHFLLQAWKFTFYRLHWITSHKTVVVIHIIYLQGFLDTLLLNYYFFISLWFYSPLDLGRFLSFLIYTQSVGLLGRGISPSQGRYLHTKEHKHRISAETSMPWVGFETTIPVFERAKTFHALDRAATVIGFKLLLDEWNIRTWVRHVAYRYQMHGRYWSGNLNGREPLEGVRMYGIIIVIKINLRQIRC